VEFLVVRATVDIVHWYGVLLEIFVVTAIVDVVQWYCVGLEFIVITATVDIVQWYFVLCGVYCGYCNSRYSAILLCCVWRLLW